MNVLNNMRLRQAQITTVSFTHARHVTGIDNAVAGLSGITMTDIVSIVAELHVIAYRDIIALGCRYDHYGIIITYIPISHVYT